MTAGKEALLADDVALIRESLLDFPAYRLTDDINGRMEACGLSSVALGARCRVSHTIVDKWRQGKARPNGKERMKELGMALGMDAAALDAFLYRNGYPRLYAKSPLDGAAKLLLASYAGRPDTVELYRALVERLGLADYVPKKRMWLLKTSAMDAALMQAAEQGRVSAWFRAHERDFTGGAKTVLPDLRIARYLLLYVGDSTVYEMTVTGELPMALKSLLYALVGGRAVHMRGLREKLIAFGLSVNMTEEEIDVLLKSAKLRPVSEPVSRGELAALFALREAHERYPLYEAENLARIVRRLFASEEPYEQLLLPEYEARLSNARQRAAYYEKNADSPETRLFERCYTAYSDRGVMDYVRDVLTLLCAEGALDQNEVGPLLALIGRTDAGRSLWDTEDRGKSR